MNVGNHDKNRVYVVEKALELLKEEIRLGRNLDPFYIASGTKAADDIKKELVERNNPVKKYADWIEEALQVNNA